MKKPRKPAGRPSIYSEELTDEICGRIANGQSLNSICKLDGMPAVSGVYRWMREYPAFLDKYTRAREDQADTLADEILDIADEKIDDFIIDEEGNKRPNPDTVQRSKLRVEARKWIAAKLKPKKYGEKIDHNIGGQKDNPVRIGGSLKDFYSDVESVQTEPGAP